MAKTGVSYWIEFEPDTDKYFRVVGLLGSNFKDKTGYYPTFKKEGLEEIIEHCQELIAKMNSTKFYPLDDDCYVPQGTQIEEDIF